MPLSSISGLAGMFGVNIPGNLPIGFPLAAYTVEARLGGIIFPFDVGLKFGVLPQDVLPVPGGMKINYQLFGFDVRYAVYAPKVLPIKVSAGLGFNRLTGGVSKTLPVSGLNFEFAGNTLNVPAPDLGLVWETNVFELKAQVCFPILILTPYAGIGLSHSWSKAGYQIKSKITVDEGSGPQQIDDIYINQLKALGVTGIDSNGFERMVDIKGFNARLYGGMSLNIAFLKFDLTAMYNVMEPAFGGSLGVRFQL